MLLEVPTHVYTFWVKMDDIAQIDAPKYLCIYGDIAII